MNIISCLNLFPISFIGLIFAEVNTKNTLLFIFEITNQVMYHTQYFVHFQLKAPKIRYNQLLNYLQS